MKKLYVVRHAKSSWSNNLLSDYERPLEKSGINDTNQIGHYLRSKQYIPDCVLTSAAVRTIQTTDILYKYFSKNTVEIIKLESLYGASVEETINIIKNFNNKYNSLMVVGHNPTITLMINQISSAVIDHVPTSGVAVIDLNSIKDDNLIGNLLEFIYPKKLKIV